MNRGATHNTATRNVAPNQCAGLPARALGCVMSTLRRKCFSIIYAARLPVTTGMACCVVARPQA